MTGKFIMSAAAGKTTVAITGGSGNDTIIGGSSHNTIDGGAGNDTITSVEGNDTISGGAGNDTIVVDDFSDLTSSDTIDGGDGTDTLKFSEAADHDFTASSTLLNGVSNIEKYTFSGLNASDTVTINDTVMNNGAITIEFTADVSNDTNQLNASGVLTSTNTVNFTDNSGDVVTYTVGNGIDVVNMGADNDIVLITTEAYASTSDSVSGGVGSDILRITLDGGSTAATADSIATTALSGYTSFETIQIDDADTSSFITIVLDDDFVSNNELNDALTVAATDGSTAYDGTATIDASGVTLTTVLTLTGGSDTDTIKGGAGADEISGGGGIDTLTGGAGKDDFNFAASSNGLDVITDFDFGTNASTGTQDQLDLSAIATITALTLTDGAIWRQGDTIAAGDNIFIFDDQAYADADAIETAIDSTAAATVTGGVIVLWQDTLGKVHLSTDTVAETDNSGFVDLATLSGHTISSISSLVDAADFIV
jgi:Ca2+-binding RTX toxin-like protein